MFCSEFGTYKANWSAKLKIAVGVSGASGAIYGIRLMERLRQCGGVEIHLVVTRSGERTVFLETGRKSAELRSMADAWYPVEDIAAPIASGSHRLDAMAIAPCSIHTMSAIASGVSSNLLIRAADVMLKERRKLILAVRETPLHLGHLRSLAALAEMGAIIAPPMPAFYHHPQTVMDIVDHTVDRLLDLLGVEDERIRRWQGVLP